MEFDRHAVALAAAELATQGVYIGASSWKYPGWLDQLYTEERYHWRGHFSKARFEKNCLREYSEVFKSVCVDAGYYQFPKAESVAHLIAQTPDDFLFSFKVTAEITIKQFTHLPRFGARAGKPNPHFLDAHLFQNAFLAPLSSFKERLGRLIFEFSHFYPRDFERGRDFVDALDTFLGALPKDAWHYAVEIRNESLLRPEYFEVLTRHHVAHVYNNWQRMPPVGEQLARPHAPKPACARFLLTPGRKYQEAVDRFSPYQRAVAIDDDARNAGAAVLRQALSGVSAKPTVVYVNNRLEGNALATIVGMLEKLGMLPRKADPVEK